MKTIASLGLFACLLTASPADAACPADSVWLYTYLPHLGTDQVVSTTATYTRHEVGHWDAPLADVREDLDYDLTQGRFSAHVSGSCTVNSPLLPSELVFALHDRYWIVGPASPTPILFSARWRVHVRSTGDVVNERGDYLSGPPIEIQFGELGTAVRVDYENRLDEDAEHIFEIPLEHSVAEPFELRIGALMRGTATPDNAFDVGYPNSIDATGVLEFAGLPPGYTVVSCQGWSSDAPVPARRSTWGSLKTRAR